MEEKTPSCSIVEVTLSELGEELWSLEAEVLCLEQLGRLQGRQLVGFASALANGQEASAGWQLPLAQAAPEGNFGLQEHPCGTR